MTLLMVYHHQQRGPWHLVLLAIGCGLFLAAGLGGDIVVRGILVASGSWMCLFAMCFQRLTVRDEGLHLAIRFGPLPLFQRRVAYAEIESVQRGRTSWLEGWGIHLSPGGGWTWNLWGFDCVDFYMDGRRKLRVGTDDAERLTQYVQARIGSPNGNAEGHALADSTGETG